MGLRSSDEDGRSTYEEMAADTATIKALRADIERMHTHHSACIEQRDRMREALEEAKSEIEYAHADMLTVEERNHPRGSGWARVHDKIVAALSRTGAGEP